MYGRNVRVTIILVNAPFNMLNVWLVLVPTRPLNFSFRVLLLGFKLLTCVYIVLIIYSLASVKPSTD